MFKGSFVALVTPFKNGQVDENKLTELVNWQISEGTAGLVPVGTTGESATLSHQEHARVIEIVVKAAKKRVPVLAGAGSNSTEEAISLTKEAKSLGADAVLSVNPYYNKPTQEGLKAHFGAIANASDLPVILYNIPSRTGVSLAPATVEALARAHSSIVGIKEATGSMDQVSDILQRLPQFCLLSGDDSITLPLMSLGGMGVVSVVANVVPKAVSELTSAALAGRWDDARRIHYALFPLVKALFVETNPGPVKAAMKEKGLIDSDELRLPMVSVQPESRSKIKAALAAYDALNLAGVK